MSIDMTRTSIVFALVLAASALPLAAQPAPWRIDHAPVVRLGTADGDTLTELVGVSGAARLANGSVAISLGRNRRLLLFNARGALAHAAGRRGAGPGEFRGSIATVRWGADSVLVWDAADGRWSVFTDDGVFLRQLQATSQRMSDRRAADVAPGLLVRAHDARAGIPSWVDAVADSLRRAGRLGDMPRPARLDASGLLWVRALPDSARWDIYSPAAAHVAAVTLPPHWELLDIGLDYVLALTADDDGFEFVDVLRLDRPAASRTHAAARPLPDRPAPATATAGALRSAMRLLATAQEVGYADRITYTTRLDLLNLRLDDGYRAVIFSADKYHWRGAVAHSATGSFCLMDVGGQPTIGWAEGSPVCTR